MMERWRRTLDALDLTPVTTPDLRKFWKELDEDLDYSHPQMDLQDEIDAELARRGEKTERESK